MCSFAIVDVNAATLWLGLVDACGKWHLMRIGRDLAAAHGFAMVGRGEDCARRARHEKSAGLATGRLSPGGGAGERNGLMRIKLIEELPMASSAELYQLGWAIGQLLADPRRIVQARGELHTGQQVQYLDWNAGRMRAARVVAM